MGESAQHVSGDNFAHPQEHQTVFTACGIMHRRRCQQAQSSAPEDGRNYRPKHVEPIVIINKICYCCIQLAVYIITILSICCRHMGASCKRGVVIPNVNKVSVEWCETQRSQNIAKSVQKMLIQLSYSTPRTGNLAMRSRSMCDIYERC